MQIYSAAKCRFLIERGFEGSVYVGVYIIYIINDTAWSLLELWVTVSQPCRSGAQPLHDLYVSTIHSELVLAVRT